MVKRICPICEQVMEGRHYCRECRSFVRHPRVVDVDYYLNERHGGNEIGCEYHNPSFMGSARPKQAGASEFSKPPGQTGNRQPSGQTGGRRPSWQAGKYLVNRSGSPSGGKNSNIGLVVAAVVIIIFFLNLILPLVMFII